MPHVIGVVATLKIKPNQTETFEAAMRKMREQVKANESGCLIYDMHRSEEPNTYVMIEQYVNQAALDAHRSTSHMKELQSSLKGIMAAAPEVKAYNRVR